MLSVGLGEDDDESFSSDPFQGLSREEVFTELRSWREKFAALSADEVAERAVQIKQEQQSTNQSKLFVRNHRFVTSVCS